MGRTVYWMNASLDLYIDGEVDGSEEGGGDWMRIDDELHAEFNRRARELTCSIEGRRVYEIMIFTHPTVLGAGRPLFDNLTERVACDLIEQVSYHNGVVLHRWDVRGARPLPT